MQTNGAVARHSASRTIIDVCAQCHRVLTAGGQHTSRHESDVNGRITISFKRVACSPFVDEPIGEEEVTS